MSLNTGKIHTWAKVFTPPTTYCSWVPTATYWPRHISNPIHFHSFFFPGHQCRSDPKIVLAIDDAGYVGTSFEYRGCSNKKKRYYYWVYNMLCYIIGFINVIVFVPLLHRARLELMFRLFVQSGKLCGLVLRSQLIVLLKHKVPTIPTSYQHTKYQHQDNICSFK